MLVPLKLYASCKIDSWQRFTSGRKWRKYQHRSQEYVYTSLSQMKAYRAAAGDRYFPLQTDSGGWALSVGLGSPGRSMRRTLAFDNFPAQVLQPFFQFSAATKLQALESIKTAPCIGADLQPAPALTCVPAK
ncbi:MAG: hypothetical protein RSD82_01275 [Comamonas sp.]